LFHWVPLLGNVIVFQDYQPYLGISGSDWVAFDNFAILTDPGFISALLNTLKFSFLQLTLFFPAPIALAILLHSIAHRFVRRFVQSVVYLPHFIGWVILVSISQRLLGASGVLSGFLVSL